MFVWRRAAVAAGFLFTLGAQAAWGQTSLSLPAVQAGVNAQVSSGGAPIDSQAYQSSGLPLVANSAAGGSSAQGSVTVGTGQPVVSFSATAAPGMFAGAGAELLYEFALLGPADYTAPIDVVLTGQYMFTGGADQPNQGVELVATCYPAGCGTFHAPLAKLFDNVGDGQVHSYALGFQILAQQTYMIDMGGIIQVSNGIGTTAKTVSGWIDPVISFSIDDPNVDASAFHLAYSDGVYPTATTGGVPEPATWAMLLAGFAGVGTVLRHRRVAVG